MWGCEAFWFRIKGRSDLYVRPCQIKYYRKIFLYPSQCQKHCMQGNGKKQIKPPGTFRGEFEKPVFYRLFSTWMHTITAKGACNSWFTLHYIICIQRIIAARCRTSHTVGAVGINVHNPKVCILIWISIFFEGSLNPYQKVHPWTFVIIMGLINEQFDSYSENRLT